MEFELSREEMHYLLKGEHISLFGRGELSQRKSEKIRRRLIDEGLLDRSGAPAPELAAALEPLTDADDELSSPFPFERYSDIRLRSTIFIKAGRIAAARKEGGIRLRFVLEALEGPEQAERAIPRYLGLQVRKRHARPLSLVVTADEAEALGEASLSGDLQRIREAAQEHDVPIEALARIVQEALVDPKREAITLLASRSERGAPGTLVLKIRPDTGLVFRWVMGAPGLAEGGLASLEEVPEGNLLNYLIDYKGY